MLNKRDERIGEESINRQGCLMRIVEYQNTGNVIVQFDNDPKQVIKTSYEHFKKGKTRNPFTRTRYGVGITGDSFNYKDKEFQTWCSMIARCYSGYQKNRRWSCYEKCTISKEFLYYPNFLKWIKSQENYEAWKNNSNFNVDKDILCKGNKEYSPDKCCLVPNRINNLIKGNKGHNNYPGVREIRSSGKYSAICRAGNSQKDIYLGTFENEYEAFLAYKEYKEKIIKNVAEREYSNGMISRQCRDALLRYEIEEND